MSLRLLNGFLLIGSCLQHVLRANTYNFDITASDTSDVTDNQFFGCTDEECEATAIWTVSGDCAQLLLTVKVVATDYAADSRNLFVYFNDIFYGTCEGLDSSYFQSDSYVWYTCTNIENLDVTNLIDSPYYTSGQFSITLNPSLLVDSDPYPVDDQNFLVYAEADLTCSPIVSTTQYDSISTNYDSSELYVLDSTVDDATLTVKKGFGCKSDYCRGSYAWYVTGPCKPLHIEFRVLNTNNKAAEYNDDIFVKMYVNRQYAGNCWYLGQTYNEYGEWAPCRNPYQAQFYLDQFVSDPTDDFSDPTLFTVSIEHYYSGSTANLVGFNGSDYLIWGTAEITCAAPGIGEYDIANDVRFGIEDYIGCTTPNCQIEATWLLPTDTCSTLKAWVLVYNTDFDDEDGEEFVNVEINDIYYTTCDEITSADRFDQCSWLLYGDDLYEIDSQFGVDSSASQVKITLDASEEVDDNPYEVDGKSYYLYAWVKVLCTPSFDLVGVSGSTVTSTEIYACNQNGVSPADCGVGAEYEVSSCDELYMTVQVPYDARHSDSQYANLDYMRVVINSRVIDNCDNVDRIVPVDGWVTCSSFANRDISSYLDDDGAASLAVSFSEYGYSFPMNISDGTYYMYNKVTLTCGTPEAITIVYEEESEDDDSDNDGSDNGSDNYADGSDGSDDGSDDNNSNDDGNNDVGEDGNDESDGSSDTTDNGGSGTSTGSSSDSMISSVGCGKILTYLMLFCVVYLFA